MGKKKQESKTKSGSPTTTLIVALISSTLFFLLGVMVGREYTIREGMAPVREKVEQTYPFDSAPVPQETPEAKEEKGQKKVDITFYDQLVKEGDRELNREPVERKAFNPAEKKPKPSSEHPIKVEKKAETAVPQKTVAVSRGDYALQVAAFRDKSRALRMIRILGKEGFPTHIMRVSIPGREGIYYRVWVGYYRSLSEAATARRRLMQQRTIRISRAIIIKR